MDLIIKKRDGGELSDVDIRWFIQSVVERTIPDYQTSAMLMAIFFRGLSERELATWTDMMLRLGDTLDLSHIPKPKVDKHSTGGVGDKISIPLAPAVAACGVCVPMISGRSLGHTGGTLDKLESIPGFVTTFDYQATVTLVEKLGMVMIGQSPSIVPADRKLYALRDVTGTVESLPLIASSIMSKKLAEGIDGLVIDCKVGRGAFMKTIDKARQLCELMRTIAKRAGKRITCVLTDMNAPIGRTIGNSLEIRESIEVLRGGGPADTRELVHVLGAEMLVLAGVVSDPETGRARIEGVLADGSALDVFRKVVQMQGGDPRVCDSPGSVLPRAAHRLEITLPPGRIAAIDSEAFGIAGLVIGVGRGQAEDVIDPSAGFVVDAYLGELVEPGAGPHVVIHHNLGLEDGRLPQVRAMIEGAFTMKADAPPPPTSRILEVIR